MRKLRTDERGAIMLIALAFAVFGVAMLYYAVGVAQTVLLREKLQDAADATALSSAVAHARAMNFLVLLNIIMAALLAVLIAFKLVETLALVGIIVAAALAWITGGSTLSAIPPLKVVQSEMRSLYDTTKDPIYTALEVLHDTADAVVAVAPGAALAVARADLETAWKPEIEPEGLVAPGKLGLPVEDDTFDRLCQRGGKLAGGLAMKPLPLPGALKSAVGDALGGLTGSMSDWFCGESGGPPPTPPPQRVKKRYPRTPAMDRCQNEQLSAADLERAAQGLDGFDTDACRESSADTDAAQPDDRGNCRSETDCSERGPYETHAQLARHDCDPSRAPRPFEYRYQMQAGKVVYEYEKKLGWVRGEPTFEPPRLVSVPQPACGPAALRPTIAARYEKQLRRGPGAGLQPLCTDEQAPTLPPHGPHAPTTVTVDFTRVNHVLSCQRSVEEPVRTGDADSSRDDSAKYPKRIQGGVVLGSESFQTRVLVRTPLSGSPAERIVKLALWGKKAPEASLPVGHELRRYGFAQSEYFYDGADDPEDWMWNMKWRGRLRRFRMPEDTESRARFWAKAAVTFDDGVAVVGALSRVEAEIAH